jgi:hypothetical protein
MIGDLALYLLQCRTVKIRQRRLAGDKGYAAS